MTLSSGVQLSAKPSSAAINLQRLVAYRYLLLVGQVTAVLVAIALDFSLPVRTMAMVIAVYALLNLITSLRLRWVDYGVSEGELFFHLITEVIILAVLLYVTGGSTNPFISLFLVPITLAAAALPGRYAWALTAVALFCYSLMMVWFIPLPHRHEGDFNLHVVGMWFGFVLSAGLISYFAVRMNATLRDRDRALARAKEENLRGERLVALGTLAAGAAHELGTPLATMAVLGKELERECAVLPSVSGQLLILRSQIDRCKQILASLAVSAGQIPAAGGHGEALDQYLVHTLNKWHHDRPQVALQQHLEGVLPAPRIIADQTMTHAIINILNNAADASGHAVECRGHWTEGELMLEVYDRGPGLSDDVECRIGEPFFTTKQPGEGMGLGLYLAQATIQRFGGTVQLSNREGGGVCTRIVLPLSGLVVTT